MQSVAHLVHSTSSHPPLITFVSGAIEACPRSSAQSAFSPPLCLVCSDIPHGGLHGCVHGSDDLRVHPMTLSAVASFARPFPRLPCSQMASPTSVCVAASRKQCLPWAIPCLVCSGGTRFPLPSISLVHSNLPHDCPVRPLSQQSGPVYGTEDLNGHSVCPSMVATRTHPSPPFPMT